MLSVTPQDGWNVSDAAWFVAGIFLLRCILVYGYRLTVHPLAGERGPFIPKLTDWYGAYQSLRMQLHLATIDGHSKYGSAYRQGPNKMVFNTTSALQTIYKDKNFEKSKGYLAMQPRPGVYNIHMAIDKSLHRFKRRFIGQGLSDQNMRAFEPTMIKHIDIFVGLLTQQEPSEAKASQQGAINMTNRCKHLGLDIMGEFGFGQGFKMQTSPDNRFLVTAISAVNHRHHTVAQFPILGKLGLERIFYAHILRLRTLYANLTTQMVTDRLSKDKDAQKDLFSFIVGAEDPETGRKFTERELWSETRFLLVAGGDTTSTAMAATFFYLSRHPEVYAKLAHEVRSTFSSYQDIKGGPTLSTCHYLRACIDESMRMSPPASGTLWREVNSATADHAQPGSDGRVPRTGTHIDGHFVNEGADVGVNIYAIQHNEEYFPDSFAYKPERWLAADESDKERERLRTMRRAFVPFSLGSRGCAGKTMAYMEAQMTLARTMWCYDFEIPDGKLGQVGAGVPGKTNGRGRAKEFQLYEHLTSSHDGPWLIFKWRNEQAKELFVET